MAYRGEDLDLRTPQSWSPQPGDATAGPSSDPYINGTRPRQTYGRASQPILVDDVVLACCNHAFDVAVAHRASEVRLEHLLHAMTRIDGASNALEARGIRVSGLRRESATIIAGEIPIGVGSGQSRPRRSDDLEALLRAASAIAYRRNGPANVDDVLDALLEMSPDLPGIALLARHGGRVARDRIRQRQSREPLPPLTRAPLGYSETPLSAGAAYQGSDLLRPVRTDLVGTPTDSIQNARLDQIENAVRTLTSELSNERSAVSGVVQDLQRNLKADRGGLHERLQGLEQAVMTMGNGGASDQLHDRMKSLEYAVLNSRKDDGDAPMLLERLAAVERGLEQRLNELSRPWSVLSERLQGLEQTILDTRGEATPDIGGVHDRLAGLERAVRDASGDHARVSTGLADRLTKTLDLSPISTRLDIIEEAVLNQQDGTRFSEQLTERLKALEDSLMAQRATASQSAQSLASDVKALASALAAQAGNTERTHALVTDRMQALTSGLERQRTEVNEPLSNLATTLDSRLQATLAPLVQRLNMLESKLTESMQRDADAQAAHTAELKEVHEALIKLNTNQHTLAGSIDQWRLDGVGDIGVISKQLDGIEKSTAKPVAMIEALTTSVDNINRVTVERYHRRNRFWYWLFGTDDWLTASWPSQVASVENERAKLKGSVPKMATAQVVTPPAPASKPGPR